MIDIANTYKQLCEMAGIAAEPEYKFFTIERFQGGAIAIVPGTTVKSRPETVTKVTINCDPETIKALIREVLAEAF